MIVAPAIFFGLYSVMGRIAGKVGGTAKKPKPKHGKKVQPEGLFGAEFEKRSRVLPVIGEQKDIRYYSAPAKNILNGPETTGMGFWSINPYTGCAFGCAYCYARYAHRYVMERASDNDRMEENLGDAFNKMPPWLAFERNIFVKKNAPEILSRTLRFGSDKHLELLNGESIVIGTATDPYQPAERRFRITRGILEVLADHPGLSVVIITKSPLITRDIDVLSRINRISDLMIHISLITLDRELARRIEPRSPKAGATYVGACALRLQSAARKRYLPFIEQEFPHLAERYRNTYANGPNAGEKYRRGLGRFFDSLCARYGVRSSSRGDGDNEDGDPSETSAPDHQLTLPI